jgi:hypothetical protein
LRLPSPLRRTVMRYRPGSTPPWVTGSNSDEPVSFSARSDNRSGGSRRLIWMGVTRRGVVELKDIQLPDSMKRAMARQAEAEREKRAKIIAAEGESMAAAALGDASDTMMAHPLALQLRNLQTLVELGVEKNTTIVFPAPLMSAIGELGTFLARETAAAHGITPLPATARPPMPLPASGSGRRR